ncbi:SUMF1/EgtB/PvdO family nonheme iron enzyme [Pseudahrensia aquimaris]|uniref:SUMF1/EgtB/PvdO family nonheme iron enzyme n=1 Tax=Pseudahrensia aquimaris TaxID=744461 RepID=A0ABW3FF51_9HYPH
MTIIKTIAGLAIVTSVAAIGYNQLTQQTPGEKVAVPELVTIPAGSFDYRRSGEFLKSGAPVNAPVSKVDFKQPLHVTKYQISRADYARCVADDFCETTFGQTEKNAGIDDNRPVTGVSYLDAVNYARWLTTKTGVTWRLPADTEWAYAAGSRFFDDAKGIETSQSDPSKRMLSKYQQSIDLDRDADPIVRIRGGYGANENGLFDLSGNVWEWTSTCYKRSKVSQDGKVISDDGEGNCGVRVVEGRHRSYMTFFIKDAKSGGCAVGTPPDYLGFRLVKDNPPLLSIRRVRNWLKAVL